MNKSTLLSILGWGFILWLSGYLAGIILYFFVPAESIGWILSPLGVVLTVLVLEKKIILANRTQAIEIGCIWAVTAIIADYFLLVRLFHPADGYYKLDVYLYYLLTLCLPPIVTLWKHRSAWNE